MKGIDKSEYELYIAARETLNRLQAAFAPNPEIDSAEAHISCLHGIVESCLAKLRTALDAVDERGIKIP